MDKRTSDLVDQLERGSSDLRTASILPILPQLAPDTSPSVPFSYLRRCHVHAQGPTRAELAREEGITNRQ